MHYLFTFMAVASFTLSAASPTMYPELIPGPGLPSLSDLNITIQQLYTMPLDAPTELAVRATQLVGSCGGTYTNVNEVIALYNYLKNLGTTICAVGPGDNGAGWINPTVFCTTGHSMILGRSSTGRPASSYCRDVATAVLNIVNKCTRPDNTVAGFDAAAGNGELWVDVEYCPHGICA